jgi:hypothetical protein
MEKTINLNPENIFNYKGIELSTRGGGTIVVGVEPAGGGWHVCQIIPPAPWDKSDQGMFALRLESRNLDVWETCRILNNEECFLEDKGGKS